MQNNNQKIKYAFWGTGQLAESALYALYKNNNDDKFSLEYIFTKPDAEVGREKILTASMIKKWGDSKGVTVIQPTRLKPTDADLDKDNPENKIDGYNLLKNILSDLDVCIVASYGMIIPKELLDLPKHGFINIHPSDLPHYRGPSPIESQLLNNYKEIVISIMKLDAGMDSGDIIIKNKINIDELDTAQSLEIKCGQAGGELISNILTDYIEGNIKLQKQDDAEKTICKFVNKSDGEIKLSVQELIENTNSSEGEQKENNKKELEEKLQEIKNKWRAYYPWPGIFFFVKHNIHNEEKNIRVKISDFDLQGKNISECIKKVIPEGKKEITFEDFRRGYLQK